jgi:2-aminoethylphosphonate-pyruvate transaminase
VYLALPTLREEPMPCLVRRLQPAYALDEALAELLEEGVDARVGRYRAPRSSCAPARTPRARAGAAGAARSNSITSLRLPRGRMFAELHDALKARGFVPYTRGRGR